MKHIIASLKALTVFSLVTGVLYPLVVTGLGQALFPFQSKGSLIEQKGILLGSQLIGQKFESASYFHPRPSAGGYATVASGASNLGPTSAALKATLQARREQLGVQAPADLLMASGSGLDPHISPEAAVFQLPRIIQARSLNAAQATALRALVSQLEEKPTFGILGQSRVNVLMLNLRLDAELARGGNGHF